MQPNNLTALDFEDIKSSIRSYLRTRTEFSDYDFEGSGLSYLIDVLAYNTYYSSFMANLSMNEAFLSSSTVRDNVVNIAKLLNYTPKSVTASRAYFHLTLQTEQTAGAWPNNATISKGAFATGANYTWNILDPLTAEVDQTNGKASWRCVPAYEGSIITFSYTVNTFAKQRYIIPTSGADISTLKVTVRPNESSTTSDVYNKVENITNILSTDRVYFLSETEDKRYELVFGDGVIGRQLVDGEVITLEYLVCAGKDANDVNNFTVIGRGTDSNDILYNSTDFSWTLGEKSRFGDDSESIESIKFNAPRFYSAQYRAVTAQDYETIVKRIYTNVKTVVAYGGDQIFPPVYGKVFIAIKTQTGSNLNDTTKKSLSQQLRAYAMASIEPVIVDADSIYVYPKVYITYDPACSNRSVSSISSDSQAAINDWAVTSNINNFGGSFSLSKFQKAISLSNNCIVDVSSQVSLLKYINPFANETNTYCITTGSPIYDSAPGQTDPNCAKEPVIRSGTFRLLNRPTVDQQFEDDGNGRLVTYYNSGNRKIITNASAGTVNYETGEICFGPVNVIGAGGNNLPLLPGTGIDTDNDGIVDDGEVDTSPAALEELGNLLIPVQIIPENSSTISNPTPGTVIEIIKPEIAIVPVGTVLPPNIPLNSLTPGIFSTTPTTIDIPDIANPGNFTNISCF